MKSLIKGVVAGLALSVALSGIASAQTIRMGTEGAYPPYNFINDSGQVDGFERELGDELCKRAGLTCEWVTNEWDSIIPNLVSGNYDTIIAGMSITAERMEQINFSRGYFNDPARIAVLSDSDIAGLETVERLTLDDIDADEQATIDKLREALAGKTVGAQTATTHENFINEYLADVAGAVRAYQTQDDLNLDLQLGRIDAAFADNGAFAAFMETDDGSRVVFTGPKMLGGVYGAGVGVGLRKENEDLMAMFNKAIEEATADGTTKRISEEWFGFDLSM